MNKTASTKSGFDGIVVAIGVLAILLSTATGNAYAMFLMAIVGLAVIVVCYRRTVGRPVLLAMAAAAMTAFLVAAAMSEL